MPTIFFPPPSLTNNIPPIYQDIQLSCQPSAIHISHNHQLFTSLQVIPPLIPYLLPIHQPFTHGSVLRFSYPFPHLMFPLALHIYLPNSSIHPFTQIYNFSIHLWITPETLLTHCLLFINQTFLCMLLLVLVNLPIPTVTHYPSQQISNPSTNRPPSSLHSTQFSTLQIFFMCPFSSTIS